jgi:hypothetical protein
LSFARCESQVPAPPWAARLLKRCNTKMAGHISPFLWVLWRTHLGWTGAGVLLSRRGIGATPSRSHLTGRRGLLTRMASRLALQAQAAAQRLTNHYKRQRPPSARRSSVWRIQTPLVLQRSSNISESWPTSAPVRDYHGSGGWGCGVEFKSDLGATPSCFTFLRFAALRKERLTLQDHGDAQSLNKTLRR